MAPIWEYASSCLFRDRCHSESKAMTPPNCSSEKYSRRSRRAKSARFSGLVFLPFPASLPKRRCPWRKTPARSNTRQWGNPCRSLCPARDSLFQAGRQTARRNDWSGFYFSFQPNCRKSRRKQRVFFKIGNHTENILIRQNNLSNFNLSIKLSNDKNLFKNSSLNYLYTKYKFWRSKIFVCCQTIISYRYPI